MKKFVIMPILFFMALCCSCSGTIINDNNQKIKIIATLFPQYDFARQIAGDKAEISLLLPPGTESHTFDPKPSDIANIYNADIFIYTGEAMEPWAKKIIDGLTNEKLLVIDCSEGVDIFKDDDVHDEDNEDHEYDPHIWLDPSIAIDIVDKITKAICTKDYDNSEYYQLNANDYANQLKQLDNDFYEAVRNGKRDTIVFGGRFSYIYFLNHYGLNYKTVYDSCSSQAEPSISKVVEIINYIKENNIPAIYHEEFVSSKVADSIAEQTGAKSLLFSTVHNLSEEELENGATYIGIMRQNLENLKEGLN